MSLGTLALIGICGLCGPLLSAGARGAIPAVVGEILAGVVIGHTGLHAIDTSNPTLTFLADIGFAMLMFNAGMNVPLHDERVRTSLGRGALAAGVVAILAVGAGLLVSRIGSTGHPAVYAVLIASGSAAVVLPVIQERRLTGEAVLTVIAQVTVADIVATIAIPFVLAPAHASHVAGGTLLIAVCVIAIFAFARALHGRTTVRALRRQSKRRRWVLDLRIALIVLFGLSWIAQQTGASLLIAGFGAGLMVAALGGPKRLSTEVLGVAGGFFVPLFFVVLGARVDLRGVAEDPALIGLALALVGLTACDPRACGAGHASAGRRRTACQRPARGTRGHCRPRATRARDHIRPGGGDHRRVADQPGSLQYRGGSADPSRTAPAPAARR